MKRHDGRSGRDLLRKRGLAIEEGMGKGQVERKERGLGSVQRV
jgi:hypothetical protein